MCEHKRTITVDAKADDRQAYYVQHLKLNRDGYAPRIQGLCGGDYIEFKVCLDCGVVTTLKLPVTDEDIEEAFE